MSYHVVVSELGIHMSRPHILSRVGECRRVEIPRGGGRESGTAEQAAAAAATGAAAAAATAAAARECPARAATAGVVTHDAGSFPSSDPASDAPSNTPSDTPSDTNPVSASAAAAAGRRGGGDSIVKYRVTMRWVIMQMIDRRGGGDSIGGDSLVKVNELQCRMRWVMQIIDLIGLLLRGL